MKNYSITDNTYGTFPDVAAQNATGPGTTDGTPFTKEFIDDLWGARQALMDAAGLTPDGVTESASSSQELLAIREVIRRMLAAERTTIGGIVSTSLSTTLPGIYGAGHATGPGGGGAAGEGGHFVGGYAADGVYGEASTEGQHNGVFGLGSWGIYGQSNDPYGTGAGVMGVGGTEGNAGGIFHGSDTGTTAAPGVQATGGNDGHGIEATGGYDGGHGVYALGGATGGGRGGYFAARSGNTDGIYSEGYGAGYGGTFYGGASGGGIYVVANGSAHGGTFYGGSGGDAVRGVGAGAGTGIHGIAGSTGGTVGGIFESTNGAAIRLVPRLSNPDTLTNGDMWITDTDVCVLIGGFSYKLDKTVL